MRYRKATAGEAQLFRDSRNDKVGVAVGPHRPKERLDVGIGRGVIVRNLCKRNHHYWIGREIKPVVVGVAHHADNLPVMPTLLGPWFAVDDVLTDRILVGPKLLGQSFIDKRHSGRAGLIVFSKVASTQNWNLERAQISRRDAHPPAHATILLHPPPNDLEPQRIFHIVRQPVRSGRNLNSGDGVQPLAPIPRELSHADRLLVAVAVERHLHGEHVVRIEAGTNTVQGDKCADQKRRPDQQHQCQRHLADDQHRAGLALAESGTGAVAAFLQRRVQVRARGVDRGKQPE